MGVKLSLKRDLSYSKAHYRAHLVGGVEMVDVFEPRKVLANPRQFGRFRDGQQPASTHTVESDQFRAANLQHVVSYEFRRWVGENWATLDEFAHSESTATRKVSVDRLRRVLRGETMMQLTDLMLFTRNSPTALKAVFELLDHAATDSAAELAALRYRVEQFEWMTKELKIEAPRDYSGKRWPARNPDSR